MLRAVSRCTQVGHLHKPSRDLLRSHLRCWTYTYPDCAKQGCRSDTWDVYVDADGRLQEFVYHRGEKHRTVIAPWTDYKKAGPLLFSLDHQGKDGDKPLHVFFSNVSVKVRGSENWVDAQ